MAKDILCIFKFVIGYISALMCLGLAFAGLWGALWAALPDSENWLGALAMSGFFGLIAYILLFRIEFHKIT